MSVWSHIIASIDLDLNTLNNQEVIEKIKNEAPEITGSEGSVDLFFNIKPELPCRLIITISGDLRDKDSYETQEEFDCFVEYLNKFGIVRMVSCEIV